MRHTLNKRKKVLLVVVPQDGEVRDRVTHKFFKNPVVKYMPLGILSLAATIREHHNVSVLDASSRGLNIDKTIEEIETIEPDVLGLSVLTYRAWGMTEILTRTSAPVKVVGGPHTTFNAQYILAQGANAVFIGDAENNFLAWLNDGCPTGIFSGTMADLDQIPFPARDLVSLDDYIIIPNEKLLFDAGSLRLPMFSSKGCSYKCIYCDVQQKTFNWKSPETVVNEFQNLIDLGATSIHILDDCFNIKRDRVINICNLLQTHNISIDWSARGMVEVRESVIAALAEAGCQRLHIGIEHLDDAVLKNLQKQQRYKMVEKFCMLCDKYNIQVLAYFILGAPGENKAYRLSLPDKIKALKIALPYFNVLTPLADTTYYQELLRDGTLKVDFWNEFSKNPVKDYEIPSIRDKKTEEEIEEILAWYIKVFNTKKTTKAYPSESRIALPTFDKATLAEFG